MCVCFIMHFHTSTPTTQGVHLFFPGPSLWWVFAVLKSQSICLNGYALTHSAHLPPVHAEREAVELRPVHVWCAGTEDPTQGAGHLWEQDLFLRCSAALPTGEVVKTKSRTSMNIVPPPAMHMHHLSVWGSCSGESPYVDVQLKLQWAIALYVIVKS